MTDITRKEMIAELSKGLLHRYMSKVSATNSRDKGEDGKRSYKKSEKSALNYPTAANKVSPYGKMGSRPIKVSATNEEQED